MRGLLNIINLLYNKHMGEDILLSPQGLQKIKEELAERKELRKDIANKIAEAKEHGDLSENAEYHQARDDQAFNEGRVLELEGLLKSGTVVAKENSGFIGIGSQIKISNDQRELEYTIVGATEADPAAGMISCESPLGVAFLGKKVGEQVEVKTPNGVIKYTINQIN